MISFDAFISYSSKDKVTADAACAALEAAGIRCWIAPRDIIAGAEYGDALIDALDNCRVMVLIFSSNANTSPQIRREVERAVSRGVPVIPLRIENVVPTKAMAYFVNSVHWLDALTPPLEAHLQRLSEAVQSLLLVSPQSISSAHEADVAAATRSAARTDVRMRPAGDGALRSVSGSGSVRKLTIIGGFAIGALALGVLAILVYGRREPSSTPGLDLDEVAGTYVGTYTGTHAPGENRIVIDIKHVGSSLTSSYETGTGVRGVSNGNISGNVGTTTTQNTSPNCPGTFQNSYIFYPQTHTLTWTFSGDDCLGHEEGQGQATRQTINLQ
jgi:hypothetical protein